MPDLKIFRSATAAGATLRAVDDEHRTIEGYAVVFNVRSRLVRDTQRWRLVEEVIMPDAISEELLRSSDIIATMEHNMFRVLARSVNGEGTLKLEKDEKGVKFRFDAPNTPDGQVAYEGVKRGDYRGCSFAYANDDDDINTTYTKEGEGADATIVRTVNKIDHIFDVSIVLHPVYNATSVETRSMESLEAAITRAIEPETPKAEVRSEEMKSDYDRLSKFVND